jgi:glycosyltransferase involved in cell wall biosynthesis
MKVAVVTPSIASEHLQQCLESVRDQSYKDLNHYVVIDGTEYNDRVRRKIIKARNVINTKIIFLEDNIGKGWYGHRVYAACPFLVNADVICYLDEDNWYEPCHIEKIVDKLKSGYDWTYSLRKIYDKNGDYICEDNCESLGKWPVYFNDSVFHVDTSSFAVKRDIAVKISHAWYGQWGADRQFFGALKQYFPNFDCTKAHTLCYRLDGNPNSVSREFFDKGNALNELKYKEGFPWKRTSLISVGPGISLVG